MRISSILPLTFSTPPDFEAPTDANTDNDYEITITATDDASETSDAVAVTVRVANAEDAGSVNAITGTVQVGETLTAGTVVTDQDSADTIAITGHQWQRGDAAGDNNTDIDGATGNTYEVVVADEGNTLASAPTAVVTAAADTTPPTVATFDDITAVGVIGTEQTHDITFSEAVTGLEVSDFSTSSDVTVNSVSGGDTTYTIAFTPDAAAFSLTLAVNSVSDTAVSPNDGPASAASATGTATADTTPPVLTLLSVVAPDGVRFRGNLLLNNGDMVTVTLHSTEPLAPASLEDAAEIFHSSNSRLFERDLVLVPNSDNDYTVTFTVGGTGAGGLPIRLTITGAEDAAGNEAAFDPNTDDPLVIGTIDNFAPNLILVGAADISVAHGETYNDRGFTIEGSRPGSTSDTVHPTTFTRDGTTVDAVDTNTAGTYIITYTVTDRAGNAADPLTRTVTVGEPTTSVALALSAAPALTTSNAGDYARDGDTLTLTFTLNQALAATPAVTVTIAGQTATVVKGSDNDYTATYVVAAGDVTDGAVMYDIGAMTAAGDDTNTLDPDQATSAITMDITAPTVTLGPIAPGVVNVEQMHDITFSEEVTGLEMGDFLHFQRCHGD